jgi:hypothetical protein
MGADNWSAQDQALRLSSVKLLDYFFFVAGFFTRLCAGRNLQREGATILAPVQGPTSSFSIIVVSGCRFQLTRRLVIFSDISGTGKNLGVLSSPDLSTVRQSVTTFNCFLCSVAPKTPGSSLISAVKTRITATGTRTNRSSRYRYLFT